MDGFLGTNASLSSDLSLLAYILLIVPSMLVGYFFARRKMFVPHHKLIMTAIVLINWVIIVLLMALSYNDGVAPYVGSSLGDARVLLPTIHLVTGALAQVIGTYLVLRMWFENQLPAWVKVKRIKRWMRLTLALWLVTAALGITTYFVFYTPTVTASGADVLPPAVTQEAPQATEEATPADAAAPVVTEEAPAPVTTPES